MAPDGSSRRHGLLPEKRETVAANDLAHKAIGPVADWPITLPRSWVEPQHHHTMTRPERIAIATASRRPDAPSFSDSEATWNLAVWTDTESARAIALLEAP